MAYHVLVFQGNSTTTTLAQINSVTDGTYPQASNNYIPQVNSWILGAFSCGVNLTQSALSANDWTGIQVPQIQPVVTASTIGSNPNYQSLLFDPLPISALNQLQNQAASSSGTNSIVTTVFISNTPSPDNVPIGKPFMVRATTSSSTSANAWTNTGTLTFATPLPGNLFAVVGGFVVSTTGIAWRILVPGNTTGYRAGGLCVNSIGQRPPDAFLNGNMGTLATFRGTAPPTIDVFTSGTDSNPTVFLQIIPLN